MITAEELRDRHIKIIRQYATDRRYVYTEEYSEFGSCYFKIKKSEDYKWGIKVRISDHPPTPVDRNNIQFRIDMMSLKRPKKYQELKDSIYKKLDSKMRNSSICCTEWEIERTSQS